MATRAERREQFIRWYAWSLTYKDCDPAIWLANYIFKRFEFNSEQRYWLSWLYGNTYYYPTAFLLWNEFPDFERATQDRVEWWNTANYKRLRYQTDTKYNKGHLPAMFASYKKMIGGRHQEEFFRLYLGDNEHESFWRIWNLVKEKQHKFGRYTTWFYLQTLKHCCGLPIQPNSLMLDDHSGSRSHRNGLHYALAQDDQIDTRLTAGEVVALEGAAMAILSETQQRYPKLASQIDPFTMETCLCSFKKLFRTHHGRYLGYYLDRQSEEIQQVEKDGWHGIEWNVLWQAREETLDPRLAKKNANIEKHRFENLLNSNTVDRMSWLFPDSPPHRIGLENFIV